jgi:hypothetical protein
VIRTTYGEAGRSGRQQAGHRNFRQSLFWLMALAALGGGIVWALPEGQVLRFSDTPFIHQPASTGSGAPINPTSSEPDSPMAPAKAWLKRNDWQQLWPLLSFSSHHLPSFAGPATQRYLRLNADDTFYIWGHPLDFDPQRFPILALTWGVERFPKEAALDVYGRNDRALAVMISFGPKVSSPGLMPNIPRALAFFWGETEAVGRSYTCIKPRLGPADKLMQCKYPHVKYVALRRGGAGSVHTDRVNLLEMFRQYFPDYWQKHQRVPPVVGVSFEARSDQTESVTVARLYAIAFTSEASPNGQISGSNGEGK